MTHVRYYPTTAHLEHLLDHSVDTLRLTARTARALESIGVRTIRELVALDAEDLLKTSQEKTPHNFGRKSLERTKWVLDEINLCFGMRFDQPNRIGIPMAPMTTAKARLVAQLTENGSQNRSRSHAEAMETTSAKNESKLEKLRESPPAVTCRSSICFPTPISRPFVSMPCRAQEKTNAKTQTI